jgi:hypothetical protein
VYGYGAGVQARAEFDPEFMDPQAAMDGFPHADLCRGVRRQMVELIHATRAWLSAAGRLTDYDARFVREVELMRRHAEQIDGDDLAAWRALVKACGPVLSRGIITARTPEEHTVVAATERLRWAAMWRSPPQWWTPGGWMHRAGA